MTQPHSQIEQSIRLSIIVCTYNRYIMVREALTSLCYQSLSPALYEVIIVDNGSSDNTYEWIYNDIEQLGTDGSWQIRCLREPLNGLAYAREAGLKAAAGEIIVFMDDDAIASPTLLEDLLAAYEETGADAIGGRVLLHWEARRPFWLKDDLLHELGYFSPGEKSCALSASESFSNCCFSVRRQVLQHVGMPSPLLSKRLHAPAHIESEDFCQRLHHAGYRIWYDPRVLVVHRVRAARLQRSFFTGRAYWQGRAEVLRDYFQDTQYRETDTFSFAHVFHTIQPELYILLRTLFWLRPLLSLSGQSTLEQLRATMEQERNWGRLRQKLQIIERAPVNLHQPSILLIHAGEKCAQFLARGLWSQATRCTTSIGTIPLTWLWQHRSYLGQSIAIVHIYQPGAFDLNYWQSRLLWLKLRLAHALGIRIVVTDNGGWWQYIHTADGLRRRQLEKAIISQSDQVLAHTCYPDRLYTKQPGHVQGLPHPGLRGYFEALPERAQALSHFDLPTYTGFVYLCIASMHTEDEILQCIECFTEAYARLHSNLRETPSPMTNPQLLILGKPGNTRRITRILKRASRHHAIHLALKASKEDIPLGIAAASALLIPHRAQPTAGMPEAAMLCYSYGRIVIAPDLPRFQGMFPPHAAFLFNPEDQETLINALLAARTHKHRLSTQEIETLNVEQSWKQYAHRVLAIYHQLLHTVS